MNRKKQKQSKSNEDVFQINERLDDNVLSKLKIASKQLKEEEIAREEEKREVAKQKRIEKEKNKTFEQLLEDSNLDWKNFK